MRRRRTFLAVVTVLSMLVLAGPLAPTSAAVTADATYAASTRVARTPTHTLKYAITVTRSGTFSRLVLPLPATASKSATHRIEGNIKGARLESVSGGFVVRAATPYSVAAGTRLWVTISGLTMPQPGSYAVTITAYASNGTIMARGGTPTVPFSAPVPCPSAWPTTYVRTENARAGTTSWRLPTYSNGAASGYPTHTSAKCGDTVTFRVHSVGTQLAVSAYRMGYYGGVGARGVWFSRTAIRGFAQPAPLMIETDSSGRTINMPTARNWQATFSIRIDGSFAPGFYLIKVTDLNGRGSFMPLIVRDDVGSHDKLVVHSVATWHAYNAFGGASAYTTPVRSTRVSYDRPHLRNQGSGDFLGLEYGLVFWGEKQGFDFNYAADTDLHSRPYLNDRANTLVLMPHTEYWSVDMRRAVDADVASGKKLASFGANQIYWRINPKPSPLTGTDREFEIFRTGDTSRFRDPPDPHPEQSLLGAMFGCMHMDGSGTPNNTWLWQGVSKSTIPHLAQGEVDQVQDEFAKPDGLQVLTTMTLDTCGRADDPHADIVAVDHGNGGRVFNASTFSWVCMLYGNCPWPEWAPTATAQQQIGQATMNVFSWLDNGAQVQSLAEPEDSSSLNDFREQRIGTLSPTSGMPPLQPPLGEPN